MLKRITLYSDLETVMPRQWHRCLRLYRYLQTLCHQPSVNGNFSYEETVTELAQAFGISEKTVQRTLAKGDGRFWQVAVTTGGRRILFISSRRVYETFGAYRTGTKVRMRVEFLRGSILAFRQVIIAMHVDDLAREHAGDAIPGFPRDELAKKMGVSLSTAKKELRDNRWIEKTPQVEIIGQAGGSEIMPELPNPATKKKSTRTWRGDGGELLVVRQVHNLYRAKLVGLAAACSLPLVFGSPVHHQSNPANYLPRFPRDVAYPRCYGEQFDCLVPVPVTVQPVGARTISVSATQVAIGEKFERRDREREMQGRSCLGEIVQAPAGWN